MLAKTNLKQKSFSSKYDSLYLSQVFLYLLNKLLMYRCTNSDHSCFNQRFIVKKLVLLLAAGMARHLYLERCDKKC